ncbi:MAG: acyl-CoA synthetase [Burkholderiales bacterium]
MTQRWLVQRERANVAALRFLVWIACRLGRPAGRAVLLPVCAYFILFAPRARAASRAYLARALGRRPSIGDLFRHFFVFATVALDRIHFLSGNDERFEIRIEGEHIVREQLARGQGCFLLGAHLGSFEALRALGRRQRQRICLAMFEENARNIARITRLVNPNLEHDVIALGTPESMLKITERLERGDLVGMLGDRALYDTGQVRVPFFGATASFPTSPFRIAAIARRPIVLMAALYRGGNRYDLCFEMLVETPVLERATRDQAIRRWVALYASRLEHYCRHAPYNWFNFYDFWAASEEAS